MTEQGNRVYDGYYQVDVVTTPQGRKHEVVRATNSIGALFYCPSRGQVLLIRQSRVSMMTGDNPKGLITEGVAGRFDVHLSPEALLVKEAWEEVRVRITEDDVLLLNDGQPMAVCAGMTDERSYLAYVELEPEMIQGKDGVFGAPGEGEAIIRVWMTLEEFECYQCEGVRVFALREWFFRHINPKERG